MCEPSAASSTMGHEVGPQFPPLFCSKRLALQAPHAQGWCLSPTVELSKIDGTRSRRAAPLFQYDTKPGGPFLQIKHFLPARLCTTVDHSLVWPGALNASDTRRACGMALGRDAYLLFMPILDVRSDYLCLPPGGPVSRWYTDFLRRAPASYPTLFRHAQGITAGLRRIGRIRLGSLTRGLGRTNRSRDRFAGRVTARQCDLFHGALRPKESFRKHGPSSISHEAREDS
jgi:hypothetical protein